MAKVLPSVPPLPDLEARERTQAPRSFSANRTDQPRQCHTRKWASQPQNARDNVKKQESSIPDQTQEKPSQQSNARVRSNQQMSKLLGSLALKIPLRSIQITGTEAPTLRTIPISSAPRTRRTVCRMEAWMSSDGPAARPTESERIGI